MQDEVGCFSKSKLVGSGPHYGRNLIIPSMNFTAQLLDFDLISTFQPHLFTNDMGLATLSQQPKKSFMK